MQQSSLKSKSANSLEKKLTDNRNKFFLLQFSLLLIPLFIFTVFHIIGTYYRIVDMAKSDGILKNSTVNEYINNHFEQNFSESDKDSYAIKLDSLNILVSNLSTNDSRVLVIDTDKNLIAGSDYLKASFQNSNKENAASMKALSGNSGNADIKIDGKKFLATCSQNNSTGWGIITIRPYQLIWNDIFSESFIALVLGVILGICAAIIATFIFEKKTKKLLDATFLKNQLENGKINIETISKLDDEELEKLIGAANKIRDSRNNCRKDAETDPLTGLLNRASIEKLCRRQLAGISDDVFSALMIINLDYFKGVNDKLGQQIGDAVLHDFSEVLKRLFRPSDIVGRFAGDEFIVFLGGLPNEEIALQKARRILEAAANVLIGVDHTKISASIGISVTPRHGKNYESLFNVAAKSVCKVKENGKNGISIGEGEIVR